MSHGRGVWFSHSARIPYPSTQSSHEATQECNFRNLAQALKSLIKPSRPQITAIKKYVSALFLQFSFGVKLVLNSSGKF